MEQTAGPALPHAFVESILGANRVTGAVAGVPLTLVFDTDVRQDLNGIIDRPTTTRFRALIPGWYKVYYSQTSFADANDRGATFDLFLNGLTQISGSQTICNGKNIVERSNSSSNEVEILLAANDYIEMRATPNEANAITVVSFSKLKFELVRPV